MIIWQVIALVVESVWDGVHSSSSQHVRVSTVITFSLFVISSVLTYNTEPWLTFTVFGVVTSSLPVRYHPHTIYLMPTRFA